MNQHQDSPADPTSLVVNHLTREFGDFRALGPLSFSVSRERVVGVVGPSGCGKSTLLRLLAGLDKATSGGVELDGQRVVAPRTDIGIVFQEPRLLPWATVAENVGLGLWHLPRHERDAVVADVLKTVELTRFAKSLPKELSGGMAQRVGIARALVLKPRLLLLDEPFGALDPLTRIRMQDHLLDLVGNSVPLVVLITHDIEEALVLSDRVLVLAGPPGRVTLELAVDLERPRRRSGAAFQALKDQLFAQLVDKVTV